VYQVVVEVVEVIEVVEVVVVEVVLVVAGADVSVEKRLPFPPRFRQNKQECLSLAIFGAESNIC
jgi:hypothetical protein